MIYEIIKEIKNECGNNQMRDVFVSEEEIADPEIWIRTKEPFAETIERDDMPAGMKYRVFAHGLFTEYTLTEA